jgi:hypothetical protein
MNDCRPAMLLLMIAVGWIVGALEGAAVGGAAGVFAGGPTTIGVPEDSVVKYELEVKAGKISRPGTRTRG